MITILLTLTLTCSLPLYAPMEKVLYIQKEDPINPYLGLSKAIDKVETNCNPLAVGDKHLKSWSYGIKQIRQIKLDWYNMKTGKHYTLKDCFNEEISQEIFMYHCMHYITLETSAKRWNGSGSATLIYWNKVKKLL